MLKLAMNAVPKQECHLADLENTNQSSPNEVTDGNDDAANAARLASRRSNGRMLLIILSIGVLATLFVSLPAEISRWYLAEAMESAEEGNYQRAIDVSHQADDWAELPETSLSRAEWLIQVGDKDAAVEEIVIAGKRDPGNWNTIFQCSTLLMDAGQPEMSAELIRESQKEYPVESEALLAQILNAEAYALAVAGKDLDLALQQGEKSLYILVPPAADTRWDPPKQSFLEQYFGSSDQSPGTPVWSASVYDTVGYIYYLQGDYEAARADLDLAVSYQSLQYRLTVTQLQQATQMGVEPDDYKPQLTSANHTLAVLHYHRGLTLAALGLTDEADADFQRVRQLGFTPGDDLY